MLYTNIKTGLNFRNDNNYLLNTFLFVFCFFAFFSIFNHLFIYISIFAIIFASILLDTNKSVVIVLFTYPFEVLFHFSLNENYVNLFPYISATIFFILGIRYIVDVFKRKEILDKKLIVAMAIFLLYIVLPINKIKIVDYLQYVAGLGIVYLLYKNKNKLNKAMLINYSVLGLVVSVSFSIILQFYNIYGAVYQNYYTDGLLKIQGLFVNPNYLMMFVCLLSAFLKTEFLKNGKVSYLIEWLFVFVIGYATISRNFVFCEAVLFVFLFVCCCVKKDKIGIKNFFILFAFCIIIMLVLFDYSKSYFLRLKDFIHSILNSSASNPEVDESVVDPGRILIWKRYLKSFFASAKSILFGYGISAPTLMIKAHNTYIYGFWLVGIIGISILSFIITKVVFSNNKNKNLSFWSVLLSFTVLSFFESNFLNMVFLVMFALLMASCGGAINEKK